MISILVTLVVGLMSSAAMVQPTQQRVMVNLTSCDKSAIENASAEASTLPWFSKKLTPDQHFIGTGLRTGRLYVTLSPGSYDLAIHSKHCHAEVHLTVLAGFDRHLSAKMITKDRIMMDHWRWAVAGRLPQGISRATLYGVDEFGGRIEALVDAGAFYADWVSGARYIVVLEPKRGHKKALFAVDLSKSIGALRYDISDVAYRGALARHGSPFSHPTKIVSGPGGDMWFLNPSGNRVGRVDAAGHIREYELPTFDSIPVDIAAMGNSVWITEFNSQRLARITVGGQVSEFTLPHTPGPTFEEPQGRGLEYLAAGSDGRIWFSERFSPYLGAVDKDGRVAEYPIDGGTVSFFWTKGIVRGPDGRIWFIADTGPLHGVVGAVSRNGAVQRWEFDSGLTSITSGLNDVWVSEEATFDHSHITRIDLNGKRTRYEVPLLKSTPQLMAEAADGALWFSADDGNTLGEIGPDGTMEQAYQPDAIASLIRGPDGKIWYSSGGLINGRSSLLAGYQIFEISRNGADPTSLTVSPDGAVWFTEFGRNAVGFIRSDGTVRCFSLTPAKQLNCETSPSQLRRIY